MKIALSEDRILESVYAFSALDSVTRKEVSPKVLGRGEEAALRRVIVNECARMVYSLIPFVESTNLPVEDSADIIEIEVRDDVSSGVYMTLRPLLEAGVANGVMSAVWSRESKELSDIYAELYDNAVMLAKRALMQGRGKPGKLRPEDFGRAV